MKIVLTSQGSTGDIYPLIALATGLKAAGHEVLFATGEAFRSEIEAAGIQCVALPPAWKKDDLRAIMAKLVQLHFPLSQLKAIYDAAAPTMDETLDALEEIIEDADLLISSYLFPINRLIAERQNVPFATFAFAHNVVPSPDYPPAELPRLPLPFAPLRRLYNRLAWKLAELSVDGLINASIGSALTMKDLPAQKGFFSNPADQVLVAVSPALMKPAAGRIDSRFHFTGYCRWQTPASPSLETTLQAYCQNQRVPILTLGSMVVDDAATLLKRLARCWPEGKKLIIQSGWTRFPSEASPADWLHVGPCSHDQLFRHAALVAHHGGAGTTASVLHAGVPHIVIPHLADQFFFAREIKRLGCGVSLKKTNWPEKLAGACRKIDETPHLAANARTHAATLAQEDGVATALSTIEAYAKRCRKAG